jgi:hypothetical protein
VEQFSWELSSVYFPSPDEGWAIGKIQSKGVLLHYSNGVWTPVSLYRGWDWELKGLHFTSRSKGWVVGGAEYMGDYAGILLRFSSSPFTDVSGDYWASDYITALYAAGITGGCSPNPPQFCPDSHITRQQMAVFIETSLGRSLDSLPPCYGTVFADVNTETVGDAFCRFIEDFAAQGITGGCGGGNFCPNEPVTRSQMAVFLEAAMGRIPGQLPSTCSGTFEDVNPGTVDELVCRIIEDFAVQGITGGCSSIPPLFCADAPVTRAQMAVFLVAAPSPLQP